MNETIYLNALEEVLAHGEKNNDRTGIGTISIFGMQQKYNLNDGFPLLTTKTMIFESIVSELLWFIEGNTDERRLAEIRYGEKNNKKTIWTDNLEAEYWIDKRSHPSDLGKIYGYQWRNWNGIDQLEQLISGLKNNPYSRRHILSAWNVEDLDNMALPPCHVLTQYHVNNKNQLSCHLYQRSADMFLGVPYNIASYALFTHILAMVCGLEVGNLIHSIGDAHIYENHVESVQQQLSRTPSSPPLLKITAVDNIDNFEMEHFSITDYNPLSKLYGKMAV